MLLWEHAFGVGHECHRVLAGICQGQQLLECPGRPHLHTGDTVSRVQVPAWDLYSSTSCTSFSVSLSHRRCSYGKHTGRYEAKSLACVESALPGTQRLLTTPMRHTRRDAHGADLWPFRVPCRGWISALACQLELWPLTC